MTSMKLRVACGLLLVLPTASPTAAEIGRYPNLAAKLNPPVQRSAVDAKIDAYWHSLFEGDGDSRVFHAAAPTADGPSAYILDVGNADVRSEGMSYGMMIAVQTDHKAAFDALWNWAATHMRYRNGPRAGYFRWQCKPSGCDSDTVPASDGEAYIATALLMAAGRWGNGAGLYDYAAQANNILDVMLHKQDMNRRDGIADVGGVTDMFDPRTDLVVFVPIGESATFTDPSYHLPAFYDYWAERATGWEGRRAQDRRRWRQIARASRRYLARVANARTGLAPDYATFDARPMSIGDHGDFRFDAFRTAANWSVDQAWWGRNPAAVTLSERIQSFFARQRSPYPSLYRVDGTVLDTAPSGALVASNAVASLAGGRPFRGEFVVALWALDPPRGQWRYYDGLLQFMAVLYVSGRFRRY
ncbi:MAG TPA: glycosyl hydrolase family 8 [Sphingomonas sp.]|nr:glycosyl hydrolase family 8 [Sphingomonas sp.]